MLSLTRYRVVDFLLRPITLIALIAFLQLSITLLSDGFVLSFDEAIWHYIGRNWLHHALPPYSGGVDNKSPFIFFLFGLSDMLFGPNYWFPRLIGTACELTGLFFLYKVTNIIANKAAGILVIPIYGLSLLWNGTGGKYVDFTETFETMCLIIAIYHSLSAVKFRDWVKTGVWAGLALDFRITAAFGILAILLSGKLERRTLRNNMALLAGVFIGIAILLTFCQFTGIKLKDLWTYGFSDNFGAGSATDLTQVYKLNSFILRFLDGPIITFYPLLLAYTYIRRTFDLPICWCLLSFIAINLVGIFDVVHLKDILPSLALTNAIALSYLTNRYQIRFSWIFFAVCGLFFPSLSEAMRNVKILSGQKQTALAYGKKPYINPSEGDRKLLAAWIKSHTQPEALVLVHSYGTQIQCYCERLSPSIYFSVDRTLLAKKRFFRDMNKHHPELILVPMFEQYHQWVDADQRSFITELLRQYYFLDTTLYNYRIYRHRSNLTKYSICPAIRMSKKRTIFHISDS